MEELRNQTEDVCKNMETAEKAQQELIKLGGLAESALKKKLKADPSLETRQRIEKLVNRLPGPVTLPEHLRAVRARGPYKNPSCRKSST